MDGGFARSWRLDIADLEVGVFGRPTEDPRPQDTPSPQLDGAGAYDWNALASLAHDRGLRAQQEMLSSDGYAGEQHPAWQPPPATHRIPLLSPAVPALPPRTPLTREAIDASYFAVRGLEEEAEASHTSVRSLGPSGRNGNGGLLPATASIAFGGAAMPSGSITPGGSVRNANFGIVRAAPGGLLGSGFYARSRAARTPGGREVNVGPSPLAFAASGPPSVPLSEGSTPSSEGSGAGFDASAGSTGATAGLAPPPAQSGGGGGFELKIGDSSLLARRKGGKALLKAATDTPPMPSPAALAVGKGMQPRTSTAPGLAMPSVGADVVDRAQEAEEDGARLGMQQLRISGRR
ncbi:hypothetical protein DFJ74DRAFT_671598 [Hyaloraphidium curvatum]|nr:hypothetical protein DFJ74DRAFT_671598 [Hyaloraphidium curvatum]